MAEPAQGRIAWIFVNAAERRLRAGWRIAVTLVGLGLLAALSQLLFANLWFDDTGGWLPRTALAGAFLVGATAALLVVALASRYLDRRPFSALGFRLDLSWWMDLAFGIALGGGLMVAILIVERAAGWARYDVPELLAPESPRLWLAPVLFVIFVAVGVYEELVFRGYLLTNVAEGLRGRHLSSRAAVLVATLLTSGIFGVAHALNPGASVISTLNIVMAGVMLAAGYLLSAELAIPIGLHIGWNLFQNLFGMPVSGQSNLHFGALLVRRESGPDWITGGDFGPEAGLTGLVAMLLGVALIALWQRARGAPIGIRDELAEYRERR